MLVAELKLMMAKIKLLSRSGRKLEVYTEKIAFWIEKICMPDEMCQSITGLVFLAICKSS